MVPSLICIAAAAATVPDRSLFVSHEASYCVNRYATVSREADDKVPVFLSQFNRTLVSIDRKADIQLSSSHRFSIRSSSSTSLGVVAPLMRRYSQSSKAYTIEREARAGRLMGLDGVIQRSAATRIHTCYAIWRPQTKWDRCSGAMRSRFMRLIALWGV